MRTSQATCVHGEAGQDSGPSKTQLAKRKSRIESYSTVRAKCTDQPIVHRSLGRGTLLPPLPSDN